MKVTLYTRSHSTRQYQKAKPKAYPMGTIFVLRYGAKWETLPEGTSFAAATAAKLRKEIERVRAAKYTVDGGARGMREVFRSASWPPRLWA